MSCISNEKVREMSGMMQFSAAVKRIIENIRPDIEKSRERHMSNSTFHRDTLETETSRYVRRIGRPQQTWTDQLVGMKKVAACSQDKWVQAIRSKLVRQNVSRAA